MYAKVVPYSSVVGTSVMLSDTADGACVTLLALLSVTQRKGESHKEASIRIANHVAFCINDEQRLSEID